MQCDVLPPFSKAEGSGDAGCPLDASLLNHTNHRQQTGPSIIMERFARCQMVLHWRTRSSTDLSRLTCLSVSTPIHLGHPSNDALRPWHAIKSEEMLNQIMPLEVRWVGMKKPCSATHSGNLPDPSRH